METVKGVKRERGEGDGVEIIKCGDSFEIVKRDCGDYVELGRREVLQEGDVIFSGDNVLDRLQIDRLQKDGRRVLYAIPGLSYKFPKKLPQNFSLYDMKDQVKEAKLKFLAAFNEAMSKLYPDHFTELVLEDDDDVITSGVKRKPNPSPQSLGDQNSMVISANELKAEADNMEK